MILIGGTRKPMLVTKRNIIGLTTRIEGDGKDFDELTTKLKAPTTFSTKVSLDSRLAHLVVAYDVNRDC
jgi:hypothetical protein